MCTSVSTQHPDKIFEHACRLLTSGKRIALATVIETWGSSPRPVGAHMVISDDNDLVGSVSGGCVENTILHEALSALEAGDCRVLEFGSASDDPFKPNLSCGGKIQVLVEPVGIGQGPSSDLIYAMNSLEQENRPYIYKVDLRNWERSLIDQSAGYSNQDLAILNQRKSQLIDDCFWRFSDLPKQLYIVGAVHIAQHLQAMAQLAGFDVTIIDNRDLFLTSERFAGAELISQWPSDAVSQLSLDKNSALVTLTHDAKLDLPSLEVALQSDCLYIGALGSRNTHRDRVSTLLASGFSKKQVERIHGPVGLDIGSKSPSEIAVSILSQMISVFRQAERS